MDHSLVQTTVWQRTSGRVFFTVGKELPWSNLVPFFLSLGVIVVGVQKQEPQVPPKPTFRAQALSLTKKFDGRSIKVNLQHKRAFQELAVKHIMP